MKNKQRKHKWTKERIIEDAKQFESKGKWFLTKGFRAASRYKILTEVCNACGWKIRKPNGHWTKENIIKEALNYNARSVWEKNNPSSYLTAIKNGWLDECCPHMNRRIKPPNYWTKERCMEQALIYKTLTDWRKFHNNSYRKSIKKGWLKDIIKHMKKTLVKLK